MRGWRDVFATVRIAFAADGRSALPVSVPGPPVVGRSPDEHKAVVYRRLFDENWPRVRRHLACFLDDADEVDELTAEVFMIAWKKLNPAQPMGLTWFLRTADNKVKDTHRRARSKDRALDALTRGLQEPSEELHPLESLALREALRSLNARERHVVVLTYWDDLTAGEVAEVLRCSQAAVWTTLTRARGKLRRNLDETGEDA
ncbi:RNA polymerase sigma factor [Microbacterium sp. NPDC089696]|jgi:RNA polymerase sigma factor (sigma-70 family)|uniref:RNA polymerase sigma factor n=1 Tax=Microbacterium sp. NPDC089696 TaxID=3364199 RepID=UPI00380ECD09